MALLEWKYLHSVGVGVLDEQHKEIFNRVNRLSESLADNLDDMQIKTIFIRLSEYSFLHFKTEEDLFEQYGYNKKSAHIKAHDIFREKLKIFESKLNIKEDYLSLKVVDFMSDWWLRHVIYSDFLYKEFFANKGVE
jgi:hemerythrin-like metal-binding protein